MVCLTAIALQRSWSHSHMNDQWVWDTRCAPSQVQLSSNLEAAYFHTDPVNQSTGTVGKCDLDILTLVHL